jgi:CheY-like chemotaxis protein
MKLLIIDNDRWLADSLASQLSYQTKIAGDIDQALNLIDTWRPKLILTDLLLGARNALMLMAELQSYIDTRQIPVIVMSADAKRLKLADLRRYGVVKILDKAKLTPAILNQAVGEFGHG